MTRGASRWYEAAPTVWRRMGEAACQRRMSHRKASWLQRESDGQAKRLGNPTFTLTLLYKQGKRDSEKSAYVHLLM